MKVVHAIILQAAFLMVAGDNVFRSDYEYSETAKGWYKFHRTPTIWMYADLRCYLEGAVLASPIDASLSQLMTNFVLEHKKMLQYGMHTGIHNRMHDSEFSTVEGVPLSMLPIKTNDIFWEECYSSSMSCVRQLSSGSFLAGNCNDSLPFFCFKRKTEELKITECGTIDKGYELDRRTGHCYKFHPQGKSWSLGYLTCAAEGGHLAIINSDTEATVLRELFAKFPPSTITGYFKDGANIGYLDWYRTGFWRTIHGQSLKEAGYAKWSTNEPNNMEYKSFIQYCGSVFRSGLLDDAYCELPMPFICEKDPAILQRTSENVLRRFH